MARKRGASEMSATERFSDCAKRRVDPQNMSRPRERVGQRRRCDDRTPNDRLDDLAKFGRMRCREKDPNPAKAGSHVRGLPHPPYLPLEPQVRDRAMRIEQISARLIDPLDRLAHFLVVVP